MNSPLQLTPLARPAALQSVQTWGLFVMSSHAQEQQHGGSGHLLASPQPAWDAGAQTMSPRESASALDTLEDVLQLLHHRLLLLNPDTVVRKPWSSKKWKTRRSHLLPSRSAACWMERKCSLCRIVGAGHVGRKRSRPTRPIQRLTLAQASLFG